MNAWLITWEGTRVEKTLSDRIVAILSSRKSDTAIGEFVEALYLRSTCDASNMAYYANRRKDMPFKAQDVVVINGIPHGGRVFCGSSDLGLYARQVTKLDIQVDEARGKEILSWVEPPTYKWKGERESIEQASEGEIGHWERSHLAPLSRDTW